MSWRSQVRVFESEMEADQAEITQLSAEEAALLPGLPHEHRGAPPHLGALASADSIGSELSGDTARSGAARDAGGAAVQAPLALLQDKVLLHNPQARAVS